jgi:hypothetical protein
MHLSQWISPGNAPTVDSKKIATIFTQLIQGGDHQLDQVIAIKSQATAMRRCLSRQLLPRLIDVIAKLDPSDP